MSALLVATALLILLGSGFFAALLVSAAYTAVTFSVFIIDRRESGGTVPRSLIRTVVDELFSAALLFFSHPFGSIDPAPPRSRELLGKRPIILVHGYAQVRSNFWILGPRLLSAGLGPLYTLNLKPMSAGVEAHAEQLSTFIDEVRAATGARDVDVVAHSMGGIVARLAGAGPRRIRRLVTIGTPHGGTRVAELAHRRSGADLRVGSSVLSHLPEPPPGMIVAISSDEDNVVVPPANGRIGDRGRDITVTGVGHLAMLLDANVAEEVAKALAEDVWTAEQVIKPITRVAEATQVNTAYRSPAATSGSLVDAGR